MQTTADFDDGGVTRCGKISIHRPQSAYYHGKKARTVGISQLKPGL